MKSMLELKKLHETFLIHQAFMAAAAAAALNPSGASPTTPTSTSKDHSIDIGSYSSSQTSSSCSPLSNSSASSSSPQQASNQAPIKPPEPIDIATNDDPGVDDDDVDDSSSAYSSTAKRMKLELSESCENNNVGLKISPDSESDHDDNDHTNNFARKRKHAHDENEFSDRKSSTRKPTSSFLISDILGLEKNRPTSTLQPSAALPQHLHPSLMYNPRAYFGLNPLDLYRLLATSIASSQPITERPPPPPPPPTNQFASEQKTCHQQSTPKSSTSSSSILSSLEQLARSQFDEPISSTTSTKVGRSNPTSQANKKSHLNEKTNTPSSKFDSSMNKSLNSTNSSANLSNSSSSSSSINVNSSQVKAETKTTGENSNEAAGDKKENPAGANLWPAWVYCTRYSDRPSAGPRQRKKNKKAANLDVSKDSSGKLSKIPKPTNNNGSYFSASSNSSNCSFSLHSPSHHSSPYVHAKPKSTVEDDDDDQCSEMMCDLDDDDNDSDTSHSKRPRTAFTSAQLNRLKNEFDKCRYLTGEKRQYLANELRLNESQIKIWFQNKRAKIKKSSGVKNTLALQLMAQGLYNHSSANKSGSATPSADD